MGRLTHTEAYNFIVGPMLMPNMPKNLRRAVRLIECFSGLTEEVAHPCTCVLDRAADPLGYVILHLNDVHNEAAAWHPEIWTRDDIADWLDSLPISLVHHRSNLPNYLVDRG